MPTRLQIITAILAATLAITPTSAFAPTQTRAQLTRRTTTFQSRMAETEEAAPTTAAEPVDEEENLDPAQKLAREKARRAEELRAQEVFMKRSTGIHKCSNCDWEYDPAKGDSFLIGGMIKPGTGFEELPSNWRCPTCRASKDNFMEVVEEIPGFEVNQGYGFGTNSMTTGEKNTLIWGGLGLFFLLFLGGYALS
jgi:rubredoxin